MKNQTLNTFTDDQKLDFLVKQIERVDKMRVSLASRASMIVSAGALILAGIIFLLDKILSLQNGIILKLFMEISVILTLVLIVISISYAMNMIITWKKSKTELVRTDIQPNPIFLHPTITIKYFEDNYKKYSEEFDNSEKEQMIEYAKSAHWYGTKLLSIRYKSFSKSVKFLFFGIIAFLFSMVLFFLSTII